jgi:ATP-dependent Lon protease
MTSTKSRPLLIPGETRAYPVLALRDIVVFPHMIAPLFVGRKKSILALEEVMRSDTFILLATQKKASDDEPATRPLTRSARLRACCICSSFPTAPLRYWSRALSARKWSSTPIAAILRGRGGRARRHDG